MRIINYFTHDDFESEYKNVIVLQLNIKITFQYR